MILAYYAEIKGTLSSWVVSEIKSILNQKNSKVSLQSLICKLFQIQKTSRGIQELPEIAW